MPARAVLYRNLRPLLALLPSCLSCPSCPSRPSCPSCPLLGCSLEAEALPGRLVVLLDEFHAVGRDGDGHAVGAADKFLLHQKPDRELKMLTRLARHRLQVELRHARI